MLATRRSYQHFGNGLVAALFIVTAAHYGNDASAQQQPSLSSGLEEAFWVCDYVATTQGIDATPIAACSDAMEHIKNDRFGGDFLALLKWWQQNKFAEHKRLADGSD